MKYIFTLTLILISNIFLFGKNYETGLLWKVTGNDLEKPSYIFGTLHVICPEQFVEFPGIDGALENSSRIVLELNLGDPQVMVGLQMGMVMKDNKELSDVLDKDEFDRVRSFFSDSLGMNINMFSRVQPFFLISMALPHMIQCTPKSYESYFMQQAQMRDMELLGLETLQEQLNVFDALTYRQQAEMLLETINQYDEKRSEFQAMLNYYLTADLSSLEKLFEDIDSEFDEFSRRLIEERNHRWIERIEKLMKEDATFFAVGAGHLPGEQGVLKLLSRMGYVIERVAE
ncbi:MAG: TraB/GumN family protein [Bacteroidales bacterium]|nr:TraB/GumN family protein [Bacteroidales bacterium]